MSCLRQLVLIAKDLDSSSSKVCKELDTYLVYQDPGVGYFGLQNGLYPIGDSFLEIVSPITDNCTGARYINKFGDGGYMVIVQLKDANELKQVDKRVVENNLKVIHRGARKIDMKVDKYDTNCNNGVGFTDPGVAGIHLDPKQVGCIVEMSNIIPYNQWVWAHKNWGNKDPNQGLKNMINSKNIRFAAVTLAVSNPPEKYQIWTKLLTLNERLNSFNKRSNNIIVLDDNSEIRFVKRKNKLENGVIAIDIYNSEVKKPIEKKICNVLFTLVPYNRSKL
eukprot:424180_1